jgi:hypothetical protein
MASEQAYSVMKTFISVKILLSVAVICILQVERGIGIFILARP